MTGTGSLRGSSFRLPCKRTTASSRLDSPLLPLSFVPPTRSPTHQPLSAQPSFSLFLCMFLHAHSTATRAAVSLSSGPPRLLVCPFLHHLLLQHTSPSRLFLLFIILFFFFSSFFIGSSVLVVVVVVVVVVVDPNVNALSALITLREASLQDPNIHARPLSLSLFGFFHVCSTVR